MGPTDFPSHLEVGPITVPPTERWGLAVSPHTKRWVFGCPAHREVGPTAAPGSGPGAVSLPPRRTQDPRLQDWERTQLPLVHYLPKSLLSCHLPRPRGGPPPPARPPPGSCARHTGMVSEGHQPPSDHSPSRAVRMATIRRWGKAKPGELPPARAQGVSSQEPCPHHHAQDSSQSWAKARPWPSPSALCPRVVSSAGASLPPGHRARRCGRRAPAAPHWSLSPG